MARVWLPAYRLAYLSEYEYSNDWATLQSGPSVSTSNDRLYVGARNRLTASGYMMLQQSVCTVDTSFIGANSAYVTNIEFEARIATGSPTTFSDTTYVYTGGTYGTWVNPTTLGTPDFSIYIDVSTASSSSIWYEPILSQSILNTTGDTEFRFVSDASTLSNAPADGQEHYWYLSNSGAPSDYAGVAVDYQEEFEHLDVDAEGNLILAPPGSGHYLIRDTTNPNGFKRITGSERGVMEALVYQYYGIYVDNNWRYHFDIREYQGDAPYSFL